MEIAPMDAPMLKLVKMFISLFMMKTMMKVIIVANAMKKGYPYHFLDNASAKSPPNNMYIPMRYNIKNGFRLNSVKPMCIIANNAGASMNVKIASNIILKDSMCIELLKN
jgi:hypothetical protein